MLELDLDQYVAFVKKVNPSVQCLTVSAKTGKGMDGWYAWLREKITEKKGKEKIVKVE